jgi:hypothetical protein
LKLLYPSKFVVVVFGEMGFEQSGRQYCGQVVDVFIATVEHPVAQLVSAKVHRSKGDWVGYQCAADGNGQVRPEQHGGTGRKWYLRNWHQQAKKQTQCQASSNAFATHVPQTRVRQGRPHPAQPSVVLNHLRGG